MLLLSNLCLSGVILLISLLKLTNGQITCEKLDFNKPTLIGLDQCISWMPGFIAKSFADVTFEPHRETSEYFISNNNEGLSCGKTVSIFKIDEFTEIELAIKFELGNPGATVKISIEDSDTGETHFERDIMSSTNGWFIFKETAGIALDKAHVSVNLKSVCVS